MIKNIFQKIIFIFVFLMLALSFGSSEVFADQQLDKNIFFVDGDFSSDARTNVSATLRVMSERAYFYVEDNYWASLAEIEKQNNYIEKLNKVAAEFDNNIYPKLTNVYGKPWEPGIDNDYRITFLLVPLKNNFGGYVSLQDQYPTENAPSSNRREMAYINASHINNLQFESLRYFFAHEFVHLIAFHQKERLRNVSDDIWLHESRAEYSSTILGYDASFPGSNLENRMNIFSKNYSDSLGEWKNESADYGIAMMMAQYINDQYGVDFLTGTFQNSDIGAKSITEVLAGRGISKKFQDVFFDFAAANYLNDISVGSFYGYKNNNLKNFHLKADTNAIISPGSKISYDLAIKDLSLKYFKFEGVSKNLKVSFSKQSSEDKVVAGIISENFNGAKSVNAINILSSPTDIYLSGLGEGVRNFVIFPIFFNKMEGFDDSEESRGFAFSVESVKSAPPIISQLSFYNSFSEGGSNMRILGGNFDSGMKVYFGASEAQIKNVSSVDAEIVVPEHVAGEVEVKVVSGTKEPSNMLKFNYYPKRPEGSLVRAIGDTRVFIVKDNYIRHIKDAKIFGFYGHLGFDKVMEVPAQELGLYTESNLVKSENNPKVYQLSEVSRHWLNMTGEQFVLSGRKWSEIFKINTKEINFFKEGVQLTQ